MATEIFLIRHGETEWSKNGRHTSSTDLPLTAAGEASTKTLAAELKDITFDSIMSSPRQRALTTARLAVGDERFDGVEITEDLAEWHYGDYEGLTTPEIRESDPKWDLWTQGCPGGETPGDVEARLARLCDRLDNLSGTVACFAHGHILRALGALWVTGEVTLGKRLLLETGAVSELGYDRGEPSIIGWNRAITKT
jgi:broad specificity phosphatase PhoE